MELIPILSTIILVATISTFILAVGAYILYKIRESKPPVTYTDRKIQSAELVQPVEVRNDSVVRDAEVRERTFKQRTGDVNISVNQIPHPNTGSVDVKKNLHKVVIPVNKYSKYSPEEYIPSNGESTEKVLKWR